jgi:hypothetical protein
MTKYKIDCEFVNNGDDCVIILDESQLSLLADIPSFYRDLGFTMVVEEPVRELELLVFCQAQPVNLGEGQWRVVRQPKISSVKDGMCIKKFPDWRGYRMWMHVVAEGGLSLCSGVPVMQEYYNCLLRNGLKPTPKLANDPIFESGARMLAKGMVSKAVSVSEEARYSFWLAFGMLPDAQRELELYYRHLQISPGNDVTNSLALELYL